ncbi:hypothetical protein [Geosporobacter ferrireducens]|uniref:Uncharacterized protein n=1 Tax=Geosporobacter ferrireducens TaxID=1424294 RepID=A0A1D8GGA7_9FIRM|nr:hypothetical protein [Geosporobacter ferrireducens]AOT69962.1 hypothetical protein Gferi_10420 [Geosporobacter ferrireducens]
MLKKKSNNSQAKLIIRLVVIGSILLGISILTFRDEIGNIVLKNKMYTPKDVLVSQEILMRDIEIMKAIEGIQGQVLLLKNEANLNKWWEKSFLDNNGELIEGNIIHVGINNRIFADSKKPLEVRFLIRVMIYLRERETDTEVGNIVGIAGGFTRNAVEVFEGSQSIKMSVEEFEELYKAANVSGLDTKKQIDILTDLWINKTGYWRRGLFGKEEE